VYGLLPVEYTSRSINDLSKTSTLFLDSKVCKRTSATPAASPEGQTVQSDNATSISDSTTSL
jgi:hypothetical protein